MLNSFLIGILTSGILKIYTDNINKKRHVIDREKVRRLSKLDIKKIPYVDVRQKYEQEIQNFISVIKEKLSYVDLTIYNRNIEELVINETNLENGIDGQYSVDGIRIKLLHNDKGRSLTHELLHLASSFLSGEIKFSGFHQVSNKLNIGRGLNEGYTTLLDSRYFDSSDKSYLVAKVFAETIEKIVGQEKMTKIYFKADLYGLVKELSKYCIENDVYLVIKNIDDINKMLSNLNQRELSSDENSLIQEQCDEIVRILFSCYINKLDSDIEQNLITTSQFKNLLWEFIDCIGFSFSAPNFYIELLSADLFSELVKENFFNDKGTIASKK